MNDDQPISFRGIFRNFLFLLLLLKDPAKKLLPGCWPVTKSLGWGSFSNHGEMRSNADDPIMMEREFPHTPPPLPPFVGFVGGFFRWPNREPHFHRLLFVLRM